MTSKERVETALALKTPDKIPFHAYESPENAVNLIGKKVHEIYLDSDLVPYAMVQAAKVYQNDIIYMRPGYFVPEGQKAVPADDGGLYFKDEKSGEIICHVLYNQKEKIYPEPEPPPIKTLEDIETDGTMQVTPWRDLIENPEYRSIQMYVDEFKGKRFLFGFAGGQSANIIDRSMGTENAMVAAMTDPGFCRAIMDRRFDQLKEMILALKHYGADGIYTGDACASCSLYGPNLYNELFFEYQKKSIDFIHENGMKALLHICGTISPILEKMADTGADVVESLDRVSSGGDIDLKEAKSRIGNRICLKGNLDAVHMLEPGPPEIIYEECLKAMQDAGPNGYILSTEQVTRDTPKEHVLAMVQARDDFKI